MSRTLYATESNVGGCIRVFWGAKPVWKKCWLPESEGGDKVEVMSQTLFKLLFGCESVPTATECFEFELYEHIGMNQAHWVRWGVHTPPTPSPRTWTMEEIKKAFRDQYHPELWNISCDPGGTAWDLLWGIFVKCLEALPRKEA